MASTSAPSQLHAHGITTSLALVQRLKANAPPSSEAEAAKIQLALTAWKDESVPVADKEGVLAEWVLAKLARAAKEAALGEPGNIPPPQGAAADKKGIPKGKGKAGDASRDQQTARNTLVDERYWCLLRLCTERMTRSTLAAHAAKVNSLSIAQTFFLLGARQQDPSSATSQEATQCIELASCVLRCLLSASLSRISQTHLDSLHTAIEALLHFFVAGLREEGQGLQGSAEGTEVQEAEELLVLLVRGWLRGIEAPANRKRAAKFYLQHLLGPSVELLNITAPTSDVAQAKVSANGTAQRRILRSSLALLLSESLLHVERLLQSSSGGSTASKLPEADAMDEDGPASGSAPSSAAQRTSDELFGALGDLARHSCIDLARARRAIPFFAHRFCQALDTHGTTLFDGSHKARSSALASGSANAAVAQRLRTSAMRQAIEPGFKLLLDAPLDGADHLDSQLQPIRELLALVEKEKLYAPGALSYGDEWEAWEACFRRAKKVALEALRVYASDRTAEAGRRRAEGYEILRSLWNLSEDVVRADLASIWASMSQEDGIKTPSIGEASGKLVKALDDLADSLLEAHSQAREVPELLEALLQGLAIVSGKTQRRAAASRGWLFSHPRMRSLGGAIQAFTAPMQVEEVLATIVGRAKAEFETAAATAAAAPASGAAPTGKRPRTSKGGQLDSHDTLSPTLGMAAHIILALPLPQPVRRSANERFAEMARDVLLPCLSQHAMAAESGDAELSATLEALEAIRSRCAEQERYEQGDEEAATEAGAEARSKLLSEISQGLEQSLSALVRLAAKPTSQRLPTALAATIFSRAAAQEQGFVNLVAHPEKQKDDADFAGLVLVKRCEAAHESEVGDGAKELWRLVAWKWPSLFERLASAKLLVSFSEMLVDSLGRASTSSDALRSSSHALTRNAAFLEMARWREALYTVVIQRTAAASTSTPQTKSKPNRERTLKSLDTFATVAALPVEYWAKPQLELLVKRATKTDSDIVELVNHSSEKRTEETNLDEAMLRRTIEVRQWLALAAEVSEPLDQAAVQAEGGYLKHLVEMAEKVQTHLSEDLRSDWTRATLDLFTARLGPVLASQTTAAADSVERIARSLTFGCLEDALGQMRLSLSRHAGIACATALMERRTLSARQLRKRAVAAADGHVKAADITGPATEPLDWDAGFSAKEMTSADVDARELSSFLQLARVRLELWKAPSSGARQELSRELIEHVSSPEFLLTALELNAAHELSSLGARLLELLSACRAHLDASASSSPATHVCARQAVVFASFLAAVDSRSDRDSASIVRLERAFVHAMAGQPPADYKRALQVVSLALSGGGAAKDMGDGASSKADQVAAMRTMSIMLCEGPEGTMSVAHDHLARLLTTVQGLLRSSSDEEGGDDGELVLAALKCLESVCSSKAMLLRLADVGGIFAILSNVLSPRLTSTSASQPESQRSSSNRAPDIFSTLVSLLASLLRLRQDLVTPLLPQLTALLMQALVLLSSPRPDQGPRRIKALLSKSPRWLDVERSPLGSRQAREFARLLTGFTTRSTSLPQLWAKGHSSSTKRSHAIAFEDDAGGDALAPSSRLSSSTITTTKTASLAKPFAKHAPYVLRAYIRSLVAPFTWLPGGVRRELQPGLMALCDVTGELDRDAVMVSLMDSSEKTLMKELWNAWERQKYRGQ